MKRTILTATALATLILAMPVAACEQHKHQAANATEIPAGTVAAFAEEIDGRKPKAESGVMVAHGVSQKAASGHGDHSTHGGHSDHAGHGHGGDAGNPGGFVPVTLGDLELTAGFTRAMLPGQPVGGGFVTITNKGASDDLLIGATSAQSGEIQLHEMAMEGDVMKMRQLEGGIPVPAGQTVELKPGGLHLMFYKVTEPFQEGQSVAVTLQFEKAGEVEIVLPVGPARGK
ncbi:copper chaperone PCu(A)C [Peteryoungia desertarenae]|uniref:Copper chaperone PCu(A)C n=1 Tax=Peteryoungia desertarenae TaxID=1813451 RepID=A0ABX6QPU1_9HYPH|nr:copper chaperone PCu(A)C [Peteryoungia desertarenae]